MATTAAATATATSSRDAWAGVADSDLMWDRTGPFAAAAMEGVALHDGLRFLDVGAGTGVCAIPLAKRIKELNLTDVNLVASDLSPGMLSELTAIAQRNGVADMITTKVLNAMDMSSEADNTYDLVACMFTLMLLPEPLRGMKEIARVLKPGGELRAAVWTRAAFATVLRIVVTEMGGPVDKLEQFEALAYSLRDRATVVSMLVAAGFEDITVEAVTRAGRADRWVESVPMVVNGPPMAPLWEHLPRDQVAQRLRDFPQREGVAELLTNSEANIIVARKKKEENRS